MKTSTKATSRLRRPASAIIICMGPMLATAMLASCGTGSPTKSVSSPVALQSSHWYKAKSSPPTYFPKGVPADHPTTSSDGSWVMTGDAAGTRYFIPVRGVDSRALTAEALTTRTPERLKEMERREGSPDVNLANGISNAATGLGYLLLELDSRRTDSLNQPGPMRSDGGLWENKERR